ncbi:MAG: zinc-binding dehydrogenase [Acidimicrobiales bacterium]
MVGAEGRRTSHRGYRTPAPSRPGLALPSPTTDLLRQQESADVLEPLAVHLTSGAIVPTIGARYGLDQVGAAVDALEAGEITGKAVITIAP